ncbi:MAG: response regulator [Candidatus Rokubacteria bacterium]|nr:response regulator [Candidatus Rokubacteria bacterium]
MLEREGGPGAARLVIVDSYSHSRAGLRCLLPGAGCEVEAVMGSCEAIRGLKDGRFDLAVIDLDLPRAHGIAMTGWDLARIFRALDAGLGLILVAAECSREAGTLADRLERARLLEKPGLHQNLYGPLCGCGG